MKYLGLGLYFLSITGKVDLTSTLRKYYGQFNIIMSVLGKGSYGMNATHLVKTRMIDSSRVDSVPTQSPINSTN